MKNETSLLKETGLIVIIMIVSCNSPQAPAYNVNGADSVTKNDKASTQSPDSLDTLHRHHADSIPNNR